MDQFSFLNAIDSEHIDELYQKYLKFPDSIEPSWRIFFQGFDFASKSYNQVSANEPNTINTTSSNKFEISEDIIREFKIVNLINGYRTRGHLFTKTNPVRQRRKYTPDLNIENFGLSQSDLSVRVNGKIIGLEGDYTLREIIEILNKEYCSSIGIEYMYIRKPEEILWIQNWLKKDFNQPVLDVEEKKRILKKLSQAVALSLIHI